MRDAKTLLEEMAALETDEAELVWLEELIPWEQELLLALMDRAMEVIKFFGRVARGEIEPDDPSSKEVWKLYGIRRLTPEEQE